MSWYYFQKWAKHRVESGGLGWAAGRIRVRGLSKAECRAGSVEGSVPRKA